MAPMLVLRVEHKRSHKGPWAAMPWNIAEQLHANQMPTSWSEGLAWNENTRHGFWTLTQFTKFFDGRDCAFLKRQGFVLGEYFAPCGAVQVSRSQVIFDADASLRIGERLL